METYGDENTDLAIYSPFNFDAGSTSSTLYEDNNGLWATYFKTFSILVLATMSSTTATMCTKADCLAIETREQLKQIADDGVYLGSSLCRFYFLSPFALTFGGICYS